MKKKKKSGILSQVLKIVSLIGIFLFVFWMEDSTFAPKLVWYKLTHPHEIDLFNDLLCFWWPVLITASIYFNIFGINAILWFYKSLNNGRIRWGGKEGND
jgi:hypothetical protein